MRICRIFILLFVVWWCLRCFGVSIIVVFFVLLIMVLVGWK